jgi:hypothetical protein
VATGSRFSCGHTPVSLRLPNAEIQSANPDLGRDITLMLIGHTLTSSAGATPTFLTLALYNLLSVVLLTSTPLGELNIQTCKMRLLTISTLTSVLFCAATTTFHTSVTSDSVEYVGFEQDGIQHFLGIPYAQDTSGANRFKPPRPFVPERGHKIEALKPGPACPQPLGQLSPPLALGNITEVSEDCLNLNIARPKLRNGCEKLPVMVRKVLALII